MVPKPNKAELRHPCLDTQIRVLQSSFKRIATSVGREEE
jgi:hypothetical protein